MEKNSYNNIFKVLEKLFKAGFNDEKDILKMQMNDIEKIDDGLNSQEIKILIDLQNVIKNKRVISFLSGQKLENKK